MLIISIAIDYISNYTWEIFLNINLLKRIINLLHVNINDIFMKNNYFPNKNWVKGVELLYILQISLIFG